MRELGGRDGETPQERLKRLRMRCWRRGIREMDLILGPYADAMLAAQDAAALDAFEALLSENDQELYRWVSGQAAAPQTHAAIIADLRQFHKIS